MAFQSSSLQNYNQNSTWQLQLGQRLLPHLKSCLSTLLQSHSHLTLSDFGCSEGLNSVTLLSELISHLRSTSQIPVTIHHNDLPSNNWSAVSSAIHSFPTSYKHYPELYYSFLPRSFFEQVLPSNSLHLGFSVLSFHFLSTPPSRSGDLRICYPESEAQALEDLKLNLSQRLKELTDGGFLVITAPGKLEGESSNNMETYIVDSIKRIHAKGLISQSEYNDYVWQTYPLDLHQIRRVLSQMPEFEVKFLEMEKVECPFYLEYRNGGSFEDYREKFSNFPSALMKIALFRCLKERSDDEKERIFQDMMEEVRNLITDEESYILMYTAVLQKQVKI